MNKLLLIILCLNFFYTHSMTHQNGNSKIPSCDLDLEIAAISIASKITLYARLKAQNIDQWEQIIFSEETINVLSKIHETEELIEIYSTNIFLLKNKIDNYLRLSNKRLINDIKKYKEIKLQNNKQEIENFYNEIKNRKINNSCFYDYFEKIKTLNLQEKLDVKTLEENGINIEDLKKTYLYAKRFNLFFKDETQQKILIGEIILLATAVHMFIAIGYKLFSESLIYPASGLFFIGFIFSILFCISLIKIHNLYLQERKKINPPDWFLMEKLEEFLHKIYRGNDFEKKFIKCLNDMVSENLVNLISK